MKRVWYSFVVLCICAVMSGCGGKAIDHTKLKDEEVQQYLEKEGYEFKVDTMTSKVTTRYTVIRNDEIWIQKVDNPYTGEMMSFKNEKVNDELADILNKNKNETQLKKDQYKAYLEWLDLHGITDSQTKQVLEYYDENH